MLSFVESGLVVLEKKIFKRENVFSLIYHYLPFETWILSTQRTFLCYIWLKLANWLWRRIFLHIFNVIWFHIELLTLPLSTWLGNSPSLSRLNSWPYQFSVLIVILTCPSPASLKENLMKSLRLEVTGPGFLLGPGTDTWTTILALNTTKRKKINEDKIKLIYSKVFHYILLYLFHLQFIRCYNLAAYSI